jgi:hypothetical protein
MSLVNPNKFMSKESGSESGEIIEAHITDAESAFFVASFPTPLILQLHKLPDHHP